MREVEIKRTPTIEIDTCKLMSVDNTLSLPGEGGGAWFYVGGTFSGSIFRAIEMTGGIARNRDAPVQILVSQGVYDQFGLKNLPSSLSRSESLARTYDLAEQSLAAHLEFNVKRLLEERD